MARVERRVIDRNGRAHSDPREAAIADLHVLVLGTKAGGSVSSSIARMILDQREEIELVFAELDAAELEAASAEVVRLGKARTGR